MIETIKKDFKIAVTNIADKIQQIQLEIFTNANKSVLELYFYIGEIIDNNIEWGNKFVDELSIELKIKFPKSKGYSTYYRTYLITHFVFNYHLMK